MKPMKKILSVIVALSLTVGMVPVSVYADDGIYETEIEDGVFYRDNGDGTVTVSVYKTEDEEPEETGDAAFEDTGDSFVSSGDEVNVELTKSFEAGEALARVEAQDISIEFYPETEPTQITEETDEEVSDEAVLPAPALMLSCAMPSETEQTDSAPAEDGENEADAEQEEETVAAGDKDGETAEAEEAAVIEAVSESEDSVRYPEAFGENTELIFEPLKGGIKESIIINEYSDKSYSYIMDFGGLTPELTDNTVLLYDEADELRMVMPAPYMFDAGENYCYEIRVGLTQTEDGRYRLEYLPDDEWLKSAKYPVTVDPTLIEYNYNNQADRFENTFVSSTYPNLWRGQFNTFYESLTVGTYHGGEARIYLRPVFENTVKQAMENALLKEVELKTYVETGWCQNNIVLHEVTGGEWSAATLTWNNAPAFSNDMNISQKLVPGTWTTWDITKIASGWFNALNQKPNYGVCLVDDKFIAYTTGGFAISSSWVNNNTGNRPCYTITYYKDLNDTKPEASAHGNAAGSATGYADLTWDAVDGASGYYVGIFNGKEYEYIDVGNVTSWSSKGKGIWVTESERAAGEYRIHKDGKGAELPAFPGSTYKNAGTQYAGSNKYYFIVLPHNAYGQAPKPANFSIVSTSLPDTVSPSAPESFSVSPDTWTKADSITMSWSGIKDYNGRETVASLGTGMIYYRIDNGSLISTGKSDCTGEYTVSTENLSDGRHLLSLIAKDGAGNASTPKSAYICIDKHGPSAPTLSVAKEWTKENTALLSWKNMRDTESGIAGIEISVDGGDFYSTGKTAGSYSGYPVDISALSDGEHTVSVRGTDKLGNIGEAAQVGIGIDRTALTVRTVEVTPTELTNSEHIRIFWSGLKASISGIKEIWYRLDDKGGQPLENGEEGAAEADISGLSDGDHTVKLHFENKAGSFVERIFGISIDRTAPAIAITAPADGAVIRGVNEIRASVDDANIESWELGITRENGEKDYLAAGSYDIDDSLVSVINSTDYDRGEKLKLRLSAKDKAGNTAVSEVSVTVGESMSDMAGNITISAPSDAQTLTTGSFTGHYSRDDSAYLYIDGEFYSEVSGGAFKLFPLLMDENSVHSISIIGNETAEPFFSSGLADNLIMSGCLAAGQEYSADTAALGATVIALRFEAVGNRADGYEISTDGGSTWRSIDDGAVIPLRVGSPSVRFRGTGEVGRFCGYNLYAITERQPQSFTVKLTQEAEALPTYSGKLTHAKTELAQTPQGTAEKYRYSDGKLVSDSFTVNALELDGSVEHSAALFARLDNGTVYGTGAKTKTFARERLSGDSAALRICGEGVYAVRADVFGDDARVFYSADALTWTELNGAEFVFLPERCDDLYIKAEGTELRAWHVEGISAEESRLTTELVNAPTDVTAEYFRDADEKYYCKLTWQNPTPADDTAENSFSYEILKNGEKLSVVGDTEYTDDSFAIGDRYSVRTVRSYGEKDFSSAYSNARLVDKAGPDRPVLTAPAGWSNKAELEISWSGIRDNSGLKRVEFSIDGSEYADTNSAYGDCAGYMLDVSALSDGEHTLRLRGVDIFDNAGNAAEVKLLCDKTAPDLQSISIEPDTWTNDGTANVRFSGLDASVSGMDSVKYRIDKGSVYTLSDISVTEFEADISSLADGTHTITVFFTDTAGNVLEKKLSIYIDRTKPTAEITSPAEASFVNGTIAVRGNISDAHLKSWELYVVNEDGVRELYSSGTKAVSEELICSVNCMRYEDGEPISLELAVLDEAGNTAAARIGVTVNKSAEPIEGHLKIQYPYNNEALKTKTVTGSYNGEEPCLVYVDGKYYAAADAGEFGFYPIAYEENSRHSISLIDAGNKTAFDFTEGLSEYVLLSDSFEKSGGDKAYTAEGKTKRNAVMALRFEAVGDENIAYSFSTDGGTTWEAIANGEYAALLSRPESITIKAEGERDERSGYTLYAIIEREPLKVTASLTRHSNELPTFEGTAEKARTELAAAPADSCALHQYVDGVRTGDGLTLDTLAIADGNEHEVAVFSENADGTVSGTGAGTVLLRRENLSGTSAESGKLSVDGGIYALRLELLAEDGARAYYSTDNSTWNEISDNSYVFLGGRSRQIYVRAEGAELRAWHIEGITAADSKIKAELVKAPVKVGAPYYRGSEAGNTYLYYKLGWTDPTPTDDSAENTTVYEIFRDGVKIAEQSECVYIDRDFVRDAGYSVRTVRSYGGRSFVSEFAGAPVIDRAGPDAPVVTYNGAWTSADTAVISWEGLTDYSGISHIVYSVDGGAYIDTGVTGAAYKNYIIDISALGEGEHSIRLRGIDKANNVGEYAQLYIRCDRTAPTVQSIAVTPDTWTNKDSAKLVRRSLDGGASGISSVRFCIDGGEYSELSTAASSDETIDISMLRDGEHRINIRAVDGAGNAAEYELRLYIDRTAPVAALAAQSGSVRGAAAISGQISDKNLTSWQLCLIDGDGRESVISSGDSGCAKGVIGVIDTCAIPDAGEITLCLRATDAAGNSTESVGVLTADNSERSVKTGLRIVNPASGTVLKAAKQTVKYSGSSALLYIDGKYVRDVNGGSFDIYPALYPDGTTHSLSLLRESDGGVTAATAGLSEKIILSSAFEAKAGTEYRQTAASQAKPLMALRFSSVGNADAVFEYSTDGGTLWQEIKDGDYIALRGKPESVEVKALCGADGYCGYTLSGVTEKSPMSVGIKLSGAAKTLETLSGSLQQAQVRLAQTPVGTVEEHLYVNGRAEGDSFELNCAQAGNNADFTAGVFALGSDGTVSGTNAKIEILLRGAISGSTAESGKLECRGRRNDGHTWVIASNQSSTPDYTGRGFYALRVDLAGSDDARAYYSTDGKSWTAVNGNGYVFLPEAAAGIYVKAEGTELTAWYIEGVSGSENSFTTELIKAPTNLTAETADGYTTLSWDDESPTDDSADNRSFYRVYRDDTLLDETEEREYRDKADSTAETYGVSTVRIYDDIVLESDITEVKPEAEQKAEAEGHDSYLDDLYGGGYTFSDEENAPTDESALDAKLLGRNKVCANGFEPINFNTGNFYLTAQDYAVSDIGDSGVSIARTYNSEAAEKDGPFGLGWEFDYSEHLIIYRGGDVGLRHANGSETQFVLQSDGSYKGNDEEGQRFTKNADGSYTLRTNSGSESVFGADGLLRSKAAADGNRVSVTYDKGRITGFVLPSGKTVKVTTQSDGHISSVLTTGGAKYKYAYTDGRLTAVTAPDGSVTRYEYDAKGRMTAWYDGEGNRQVSNTYDAEGRVVSQLDALGSSYAIEYYDDHTVSIDGMGNRSESWFDALKRTVRTVDALGAQTLYEYDEAGNISAVTDRTGLTTRYEYDGRGRKTKETAPDGSYYTCEYDENGNLTRFTDALGNVTRYKYDEHNKVVKLTNADGGVVRYSYDSYGRLVKTVDALGNVSKNVYDGEHLSESIDALGSTTRYEYDGENRISAMTDALGNVTRFGYDAAGNMTAVTFADGSGFKYEYDALGRLVKSTDALGSETSYTYDALGNMLTVTNAAGSSGGSYDANGRLTAATDAIGSETRYEYDALGRLVKTTDALGNVTRCTYDAEGRTLSVQNAAGGVTEYGYDAYGKLSRITAPDGESVCCTYDAAGNVETVTAANGGVTRYKYDALGNNSEIYYPNGASEKFTYDALGRLTSSVSALGARTRYSYDAAGNLTEVRDADGNVTRYEYDALGRAIAETAANGAVTRYEYDAVGSLVKATDALGNTTTYTYDENGSITELVDALGVSSTMSYDAAGNIVSVKQKNGGVTRASYDALGRLVSETDPLGNATTYEYNALGSLTKLTDALGSVAVTEYDALGNITAAISPDGSRNEFTYDKAGRLVSETDALGTVTEYAYENGYLTETTLNGSTTAYEYDISGNVTAVTDAEGRRVELEYNAANAVTAVIYPDGTRDSYEYDRLGRLTKLTPRSGEKTKYEYDALGNVVREKVGKNETLYEYDALGRVTAITTADGARSEVAYDALGNIVTATDALGNATTYAYTADSLLSVVTLANGGSIKAKYDLNGRLVSETDAAGSSTEYAYDAVGRMTETTDALGKTTRYAYDSADNLTKVTDALGHITSYAYDLNGNLTAETDALGNTTNYTYTPEGWLETVTDANGAVTRYEYDAAGNVKSTVLADGERRETGYNSLGAVTTVTGADGVTEYQYDDASRLISVTQPDGEQVSYTYDEHGNRTSVTYPDGKKAKYSYDSMNRLTAVKGIDGKTTRYEYDALGQRVTTNGAVEDTEYSYDAVGNLVSQTTTGEHDISFAYTYDLAGRMTGETRTENGASVESGYVYDALGQLTAFTKSDGYAETYAYDAIGNMTAKTADGVKTQYKYNAGNQLTETVTGAETTKYSYDAVGNLVKKDGAGGSVSYTYNALNLLEQWTDGTHTETYAYNASGLLSSVTTESSTTELVWDILNGDGQVLTATTDGETTAYTYGLERISAVTGKARTEYVYDARGSVAAEVSNSGAISKVYTPFGEQLGEVTSGFGYNGEYYNAETKQVYLRARFYEPEMNRFSQKDIIRGSVADGLSLNRYLYCANDPVNYIDPSGMTFKSAVQKTASSVWNSVKSAAQSFASDPIGTAAKAVTTVVKAAANPIGTAVNIAKSAVSAAKDFYQEAIKPAAGTTADSNGHSHSSGKFGTDDGGTGIGYGGNYPSVTEDGTDLTDPSVQQSAAWDLPYIWYNEEEHAYYCGSEKITYDNDNYMKAVDYTWLEAQRNNAKTLSEALQNAKDWANSDRGKAVMIGLSALAVASGLGVPILGVTVSSTVASSALVGGGTASVIGGLINEYTGGSFGAGWVGGAVSGAMTGYGLGVASKTLQSALDIANSKNVIVSGTKVLNALIKSELTTGITGGIGGATGSAITQGLDIGTVDSSSVIYSAEMNGIVTMFAAPFTLIPVSIADSDSITKVVSGVTSMVYEIVADTSSGMLSIERG